MDPSTFQNQFCYLYYRGPIGETYLSVKIGEGIKLEIEAMW